MIEQKPFVRYHEEKQADSFAVRLNEEERKLLEDVKQILQQEKDSTAIKQCLLIAAEVIHDKKNTVLLEIVLNNYRKNKRLGIVTFD